MNRYFIDKGGPEKRTNFIQVRNRSYHKVNNVANVSSSAPLMSKAIKAAHKENPVAFTPNFPVTTTSLHCRSFVLNHSANLYTARGFHMHHNASTGALMLKIPVVLMLKKLPEGMDYIHDDELGPTYDLTTENSLGLKELWQERIGFDVLENNNEPAEVTFDDEEGNATTISILEEERGHLWSATRSDMPGQTVYADTGWLLLQGSITTYLDAILSKEKVKCTVQQRGQQVFSGYLSNDKIPRIDPKLTEG